MRSKFKPTMSGRHKTRIRMYLKCYKNDKLVIDVSKLMKTQIVATVERVLATEWTKWYIKVCYGNELWNDGFFTSKKDLFRALDDWTSKDMIKTSQETF